MRTVLVALVCVCCMLPAVSGDTISVVLQDDLEGYMATEDCMMYAPSSVAFVNYGVCQGLTAGINRWGEQYTSVLRFGLAEIPRQAKVVSATLKLYNTSKDFPTRALTVDLHELTPANADWVEGTGDGERTPTPGAVCWSYRKHDTDRWAGSGGARTPDVDFSTQWSAKASASAKTPGWLAFELPPKVVQRWIGEPASNAGLHLWPEMAKDKGDVVYVASSEYREPELRPQLVLVVEKTPGVAAALSLARARRVLAHARATLAEATTRAAEYGNPRRTTGRLAEAKAALDGLDAKVAAPGVSEAIADELTDAGTAQQDALTAILADLPVDRAREWNVARGDETDFALGVETSMVKVFRRDAPFEGRFTDTLKIKLARNEHEGAQVVVVPIDTDLDRVTWRVADFDESGPRVTAVPVGYVKSVRPQTVNPTMPSEWWPDPLLSYLTDFSVPRSEAQPLWIDAHATAETPPGKYVGQLVVGAQNAQSKTIDIEVEVYDFALPTEQHLKTIWGMSEGNYAKYYGDRYDDAFAWKYFDMFLDHRLAVTDLYRSRPNGVKGEDSAYHLASVEALKRLEARGSGWWNLGYVLAPKWALKDNAFGVDTYDEYLEKCVAMLKADLARVEAANWPKDRVGIYFLDETSNFEALGKAARAMKEAFPNIPLMTTGYDRSYGLDDGLVSKYMDIWVPLTPRYHADQAKILEGRKLGKQAWWYICVGPRERRSLNWFVQYPAIRSRLLMGVAARKYNVDGFLYYRVAGWNNNEQPITGGPYTEWIPKYHQTLPDGDGMIICAGPDGPLSTVRLENIRDGIEDYEYYWVLDDLIARAEKGPLTDEGREALDTAKALQAVPESLLTDVNQYSENPVDLMETRESLARAIEGLQKALGAG